MTSLGDFHHRAHPLTGAVMLDPIHLNARADDCSTAVSERGRHLVHYRGEGYIMAGFYFARGNNGQRELYYILRPSNGGVRTADADVPKRRDLHERVSSSP
jgi:hypothetical protein